MPGIIKLRNRIQEYAWGSRTAIADLLGEPSPAPRPQAELWMGTHPRAPSEGFRDGRWADLGRLVGELPFLLKVLAAAEPLSIQAHPDRDQARRGFRREDELGVPRDADHRNYRDPHPKPEILYALTPFAAMSGFRPPAEIHRGLDRIGVAERIPECRGLRDSVDGVDGAALERFFTAYMTLPRDRVEEILATAARSAREIAENQPGDPPAEAGPVVGCDPFRWVVKLAERYPGDRGVLAPLILSCFRLAPGQAVYTGSGVLHAYLKGIGVELMASSDNVLRGGLTGKHVDVSELLAILRFESCPPEILAPSETAAGARRFTAPEGLALEVIGIRPERPYRGAGGRTTILLCGEGEGRIDDSAATAFAKGDSFLISAASPDLRISGSATLFRAEMASP